MTEVEIDGRIGALVQQRDAALNQVVLLAGEIARLKAELAELEVKED